MATLVQYYGRELQSHKAALHTHSNTSDGQFSPEEIIAFYAAAGYEIFAFTDHSAANPVSAYDGRGMTLLNGMEIHPMGPHGERWHLLALGVPESFADPVLNDQTTTQDCIDAVKKSGGIVFCAHPAYCGFRSGDLAPLKGLEGLEVFNSSTRFAGKGYNMHCWNELADDGIVLKGIAVDDAHSRRDFFNGWTMILTEQGTPLTQETVMTALRKGDFYASQGPEIKSISFQNGIFEAEFTPCVEVIGISNRWRGYTGMCENLNGPEDGMQEISHCRFQIKNDIPNSWLRLQIRDSQNHYAWSNPIRV